MTNSRFARPATVLGAATCVVAALVTLGQAALDVSRHAVDRPFKRRRMFDRIIIALRIRQSVSRVEASERFQKIGREQRLVIFLQYPRNSRNLLCKLRLRFSIVCFRRSQN